MLSARTWKGRFASWHALVFWVWLAGFVFSFAASDQFHALNCPEISRLQRAGHPASAATVSAPTPVLSFATECAACWFQFDSLAIFAILTVSCWALGATLHFARFQGLHALRASLFCVARGPPALALSQSFV